LASEPDPLHFDFTIKWATIMTATGESYYDQGCSSIRPPLFRALTFPIGKN